MTAADLAYATDHAHERSLSACVDCGDRTFRTDRDGLCPNCRDFRAALPLPTRTPDLHSFARDAARFANGTVVNGKVVLAPLAPPSAAQSGPATVRPGVA